MTHLTPHRLRALLEGSLPPGEARSLARHLREPCEACEAVLAEADLDLDTLVRLLEAEQALATPAAALPPERREQGWEAIRARSPGEPPRRPSRRTFVAAGGAVLALAAAVLLFLQLPGGTDPSGERVKGEAGGPPELHLRVVAGETVPAGEGVSSGEGPQAGKSRFTLHRRLEDGEEASAAWTLLFEMQVDRPAARYLFAIAGDGEVTRLFPPAGGTPRVERAGSRRLAVDGRWVALSLDDVTPPLVLVGAAAPEPRDPRGQILASWKSSGAPGFGAPGFGAPGSGALDDVSYQVIELDIAPAPAGGGTDSGGSAP